MPTGPTDARFLTTLSEIVGSRHVLNGDAAVGFAVDWTGRFVGSTQAVVRPANVEQVAAVVEACGREGVAIVPQGGNTGLVGGSVPLRGEIVLSLSRLDSIGEVDEAARQVTVGAGVRLEALQAAADRAGLDYAVDFAARGSATVGGMVATNAGGVRVARYGDTRRQVMGIEAVLGSGQVIRHLRGLEKDNTGYDLGGLLCGSEGTLGVVTSARLRLIHRPMDRAVGLIGFPTVGAALAGALQLRSCRGLEAAELVLGAGMQLVCTAFDRPAPFAAARSDAYLVVEVAEDNAPEEGLAEVVGAMAVDDAAVATDRPSRERLWWYREMQTEAIATRGMARKYDVSVPAQAIASFIEAVSTRVREHEPAASCWIFGHVLDGNLHVNLTGIDGTDPEIDELVLSLVASLGGSISAEHGIGVAKKEWLHLSRSRAEIDAFRAIKASLDPAGILNPNALLPTR